MPIEVTEQTIKITEVTDVVMSTIEQDLDAGGAFVRVVRVFGAAPEGQANAPQVFVMRLEASTAVALEVTTPPLQV